MNYKNAFKCHKCPQSNDEKGCPCWWETVWTDVGTGAIKTVNGCKHQIELQVMLELLKSANGAQVAAEQARNEVNEYVKTSVRLREQLLNKLNGKVPLLLEKNVVRGAD